MASIEETRARAKWGWRLGFALGALIIAVVLTLLAGAYFPHLPLAGVFGSLAASLWPAWLVLASLIGLFLAALHRSRFAGRVLIALAVAALLGSTTILVRLLGVAYRNDVELTVGHPFGFARSLATVPADEVVVYLRDLGEPLTLRIWRPNGAVPADGWPVLMYIHGGGWVSMSNEQRSADMRWFADQGWLVLSTNYSLSSDKRHLWDRVIEQIGCSLAWTDAHADERGGDPGRLALIGESAGGNLVLNAGYMANAGRLPSACGGTVPKVRAISAIYPGVDLAAIHANPYGLTGDEVRGMVTKYVGGTPAQFPGRYASVNSASHLSPQAPPTLMFLSQNDHLVPIATMRAFAAKAKEARIPLRTIEVPFAEHGFDLTGIGNAIVRQVSLDFLARHNAPTPSETQ